MALLFALGAYFLKTARVAAFAVILILGAHTMLRPVLFFLGLDTPFPYDYFDEEEWLLLSLAISITGVWGIVFFISHNLSLKAASGLGVFLPSVEREINDTKLFWAAAVTTFLAALATTQLIAASGSIAKFMFAAKVSKDMAGMYVIRQLCVIGALFSMVYILSLAKKMQASSSKRKPWPLLIAVAFVLINFSFNYFWGNRYNIAMLSIAFCIGWHLYVRNLEIRKFLTIAILAGITLQALKGVRSLAMEEAIGNEIASNQSFWLSLSTSLHMNQLDAYMLALRDAGTLFPFREGKDFINGLLSWVPRSIYPEKETFMVGSWFRQIYQPGIVNGWPITTMGSWFVNFGAIGILLGGIFSGLIASVFDSAYQNIRNSAWAAGVAPGMAFLMFEGGVGTGFLQDFFLLMVPIYVLALFLRVKVKKIR